VIFWGLAGAGSSTAIELYLTRAEAEQALADVLTDEPGWEGFLFVAPVELAGPQSGPSLN
jgi:hypothetical protein